MRRLSEAFARHIRDYLLVETPLAKTDACIVFGGGPASAGLARHAADLYHKGLFDIAVVSGGVACDGRPEAAVMREAMINAGVPAEKILVENRATHTGENVLFSKALLEDRNISSVIAVGQLKASRRFLMTIERHWPEVGKMVSCPNPYAVPKDNWQDDPAFHRDVTTQYRKIGTYRRKGFIREIDAAATQHARRKLT